MQVIRNDFLPFSRRPELSRWHGNCLAMLKMLPEASLWLSFSFRWTSSNDMHFCLTCLKCVKPLEWSHLGNVAPPPDHQSEPGVEGGGGHIINHMLNWPFQVNFSAADRPEECAPAFNLWPFEILPQLSSVSPEWGFWPLPPPLSLYRGRCFHTTGWGHQMLLPLLFQPALFHPA